MLVHKGSGEQFAGPHLAVLEGGALVIGGSSFICTWAHGADRGLKSIAGAAVGIAALPGGRFATAGGSANLVEVWDAGSGQRLYQLRGHTDIVYCVAALPKGLLASGSGDKTVRIWDTATGAFVAALEGHMGHKDAVYLLAALPDYRLASVGRNEGIIRIWNVVTRACTQVLKLTYQLTPRNPYPGYGFRVNALVVLDGGRLAYGGSDDCIHILSLAGAGVQEAVLDGHNNSVGHLVALPNGLLASGSRDGTVRVWDVGARACVAVFEKQVNALAALPDGRLVSYSRDGVFTGGPELRVWALTAPDTPEDAAAAAVAAACVEVAPGPA
jgi:WD40 repeat protein